MKTRILIQNNVSTGDLNRGRRTESRLLFGSFCRSKKNKSVPFRELSDKQEVCPCRGSTLRVLLLPFSLKHGRLAHIRTQFSLFRRLRRTKTCHWQFFARPSREIRGFTNLESAHRKGGFAEIKLNPSFLLELIKILKSSYYTLENLRINCYNTIL